MNRNRADSLSRKFSQSCLFLMMILFSLFTNASRLDDLSDDFGAKGLVPLSYAFGDSYILSVARTQDGKMLYGGFYDNSRDSGNLDRPFLGRMNANSHVDKTFGDNGFLNLPAYGEPISSEKTIDKIHTLSNGAFLVIRRYQRAANLDVSKRPAIDIIKYSENGVLDNNFGINGVVHDPRLGNYVDSVIINDELIINGLLDDSQTPEIGAIFYKINASGQFDDNFGDNGSIIFPRESVLEHELDGTVDVRYWNFNLIANNSQFAIVNEWVANQFRHDQKSYLKIHVFENEGISSSHFNNKEPIVFSWDDYFNTRQSFGVYKLRNDGQLFLVMSGNLEHGGKNMIKIFNIGESGQFNTSFGSAGVATYESQNLVDFALLEDGFLVISGVNVFAAEKLDLNGMLVVKEEIEFDRLSILSTRLVDYQNGMATLFGSRLGKNTGAIFQIPVENESTEVISQGVTYFTDIHEVQATTFDLHENILLVGVNSDITDYGLTVKKIDRSGKVIKDFGDSGSTQFCIVFGKFFCEFAIAFKLLSLPDDSILISGSTEKGVQNTLTGFISKLTPEGTIDTSFAQQGYLLLDPTSMFEESDSDLIMRDMFVTEEGFIFWSGTLYTSDEIKGVVAKLNPNGELDLEFAQDGILFVENEASETVLFSILGNENSFFVVGDTTDNLGVGRVLVKKYTLMGDLEKNYGSNGLFNQLLLGESNLTTSGMLTEEGKVLVIGSSYSEQVNNSQLSQRPFIIQLNLSGQPDQSFGNGGLQSLNWTESSQFLNSSALSVAHDSTGNLFLTGRADHNVRPGRTSQDVGVAALTENGAKLTTFGGNGEKLIDLFNSYGNQILVSSENEVFVAGMTFDDSSQLGFISKLINPVNYNQNPQTNSGTQNDINNNNPGTAPRGNESSGGGTLSVFWLLLLLWSAIMRLKSKQY